MRPVLVGLGVLALLQPAAAMARLVEFGFVGSYDQGSDFALPPLRLGQAFVGKVRFDDAAVGQPGSSDLFVEYASRTAVTIDYPGLPDAKFAVTGFGTEFYAPFDRFTFGTPLQPYYNLVEVVVPRPDAATVALPGVAELTGIGGRLTSGYVGDAGASGAFRIVSASFVPEPATWATMLAGLGLVGAAARRTRRVPA